MKPLEWVTLKMVSLLQMQKRDKDVWASENKEPKYTPLTFDTASATKVFAKVKNLLTRVCGMKGVPLVCHSNPFYPQG